MDMRLELVPVPVHDIDRARSFYGDAVGFRVDHDVEPTRGVRVVQLTPPGSPCSIVLASGLPALSGEPGSLRGLHLVVDDIHGARATLLARGVAVESVVDVGGGVLMAGFADPDGNTWTLQQLAQGSPACLRRSRVVDRPAPRVRRAGHQPLARRST